MSEAGPEPSAELTAEQRRDLLTAADPLRLPASQVLAPWPGAVPPDTAGLVHRTAAGDIEAARALRSAFGAVTAGLARSLDLPLLGATERVALDSHLLRLPVLATVATDAAAALGQWALVGLREVLGTPIPYPRRADVDPAAAARFERTLAAAVSDTVDLVRRIRLALGASIDEVGRWTGGVTAQAAGAGDGSGRAEPTARVLALARLADTFTTVLRADRIVPAFRASPVPLLGGLTYGQALDAGWDVDVLTDVVRHGGGRRPLTPAGAAYLQGPDAPALDALARHAQAPPP